MAQPFRKLPHLPPHRRGGVPPPATSVTRPRKPGLVTTRPAVISPPRPACSHRCTQVTTAATQKAVITLSHHSRNASRRSPPDCGIQIFKSRYFKNKTHPDGWTFRKELLARFAADSPHLRGESYGVAAIESGGEPQSTGLRHLDLQICLLSKIKRPPVGWSFYFGAASQI